MYQKKTTPASSRMVRALFDFDGEEDDELSFKEGDMITFLAKIDENWSNGSFRGKVGIFPKTYVSEPVASRRTSWTRR